MTKECAEYLNMTAGRWSKEKSDLAIAKLNSKKTKITELIPTNKHKSFYGKAKVIEKDGTHYLQSYKTVVASVENDGKVHRYWDGRSKTTSIHIESFLEMMDAKISSIKEFYALECEELDGLEVTL